MCGCLYAYEINEIEFKRAMWLLHLHVQNENIQFQPLQGRQNKACIFNYYKMA